MRVSKSCRSHMPASARSRSSRPAIPPRPCAGSTSRPSSPGEPSPPSVRRSPATTEFLGYDLIAPRFVEAAANGQLLVGVKDTFTFLDAHLHEAASSSISLPANNSLTQLMWLGGDDWLAQTAGGGATPISLSV